MNGESDFTEYPFSEGQRRRLAPGFWLPTSQGDIVALSKYRGWSNLILVFTGGADGLTIRQTLKAFASRQRDYEQEDCQVLVALHAGPDDLLDFERALESSFPVLLADADGSKRGQFVGLLPEEPDDTKLVLFVLDRYGAPHVSFITDEPSAADLHARALSWLLGIGLECPE